MIWNIYWRILLPLTFTRSLLKVWILDLMNESSLNLELHIVVVNQIVHYLSLWLSIDVIQPFFETIFIKTTDCSPNTITNPVQITLEFFKFGRVSALYVLHHGEKIFNCFIKWCCTRFWIISSSNFFSSSARSVSSSDIWSGILALQTLVSLHYGIINNITRL